MNIGIDQISFYTPYYYLNLAVLAERNGIDPAKYYNGIGQEKIAVPAHDEDIVTMGVNAAAPLLQEHGSSDIDTLLFATESGIDQSKAAAVYAHHLLGLGQNCRCVELKQACYSATAALQLACAYVARKPEKKVLLIASDIARYDLDTAAEATQGAGAVAMLISARPNIAVIAPHSGLYSADIMDFWRPNYRSTPLVDGKYSTVMYLQALEHAWQDYQAQGGRAYQDFSAYCYHLPFSKMGIKAHARLARLNGADPRREDTQDGMQYNRLIGNSYTAALYISLVSLLDYREDLANKHVALFSYGSGCVGEFFALTVCPQYHRHRYRDRHRAMLANRVALDYPAYRRYREVPDGRTGDFFPDKDTPHGCRLEGIKQQQRIYRPA